jgi:hypothetical protein
LFCGTFLPKTQETGLNQVGTDNQLVTKPCFETQSKESIFAARWIAKQCKFRVKIPRAGMGNFAWGNCKRRVRRWQSPQAALGNTLCRTSKRHTLTYKIL